MACCGQKTPTVKTQTTKVVKVVKNSGKGLTPKNITIGKRT